MVQEWLTLLELTTNYMTAAEAVIDAFRDTRSLGNTREEAMRETRRLIDAYTVAKVKLIEHARSREAMLSA